MYVMTQCSAYVRLPGKQHSLAAAIVSRDVMSAGCMSSKQLSVPLWVEGEPGGADAAGFATARHWHM